MADLRNSFRGAFSASPARATMIVRGAHVVVSAAGAPTVFQMKE
jgi:hypothetical protein